MRELSRNKSHWKLYAFALAMFCAPVMHGEAAAQSKPTCKTPEFYEKLNAAKAKLTEAEGRLRRASRELKANRDELDALEKLPECDKSHTMVPPADSGCSAGCLAGLPSGLSLEASAFTGGTFATSF